MSKASMFVDPSNEWQLASVKPGVNVVVQVARGSTSDDQDKRIAAVLEEALEKICVIVEESRT